MGNAFAIRIHELQTAIINQIGIALMRGFNGRLGIELQNLMYVCLYVGNASPSSKWVLPSRR
jgi:hypothetical protein